jgi:hypothetical protein
MDCTASGQWELVSPSFRRGEGRNLNDDLITQEILND